MSKDEALKMAIKELKKLADDLDWKLWEKINKFEEALDQPAQEPMYFVKHPNGYGWIDVDKDEYNQEKYDEDKWKLYTHPHQFIGLTDDEICDLWTLSDKDIDGIDLGYTTQQHYFAALVEQALKEKNT